MTRRKLRREQRRHVIAATIRACHESGTQEQAITKAGRILRNEYGFPEAIIIEPAVKFIVYIVPIIWRWLVDHRSDEDIEAMLESDGKLISMFACDDDDADDECCGGDCDKAVESLA